MSSATHSPIDLEAASLLCLAVKPAGVRQRGHTQPDAATRSDKQRGSEQGDLPRWSLSTLAPKQLVQLIMRCLRSQEIILMARCSRPLMAAADDSFAWATSTLLYAQQASPPRRLSFPHARISFHWSTDKEAKFSFYVACPTPRQIRELLQVTTSLGPNFFEFSSGNLSLSCKQWHELLKHPSFQSLRVLHLSFAEDPPDEETFILLSKLASLTNLRFSDWKRPVSGESAWSHLCEIPRLHSLFLIDAPCGKLASRLSFVGRCTQLRKLECAEPRVYGAADAFSKALAGCTRVEHLSLRNLCMQRSLDGAKPVPSNCASIPPSAAPPQREDMDRTFAAMEALTTLELESCEALDELLPSLVHAPSLRQLIIQPSAYGSAVVESPLVCCSPDAAAALLAACPGLSMSIHLREERLLSHWEPVFKNARVLDSARAAGRFQTVDKCIRFFGGEASFGTVAGASTTGTWPSAATAATAAGSSSNAAGLISWGVETPFSFNPHTGSESNSGATFGASSSVAAWSSTAAGATSNPFAGINLANWSLSFSAPASVSSNAAAASNAQAATAFSFSASADSWTVPSSAPDFSFTGWGTGSSFGSAASVPSTQSTGFGSSLSGPFTLSNSSGLFATQPSSSSTASSWTASGSAPLFSFSIGAAIPMFSLHSPDAAPPSAALPGTGATETSATAATDSTATLEEYEDDM